MTGCQRHLFGPITAAVAAQTLQRQGDEGRCVTFGREAGLDLVVQEDDTWQTVADRLPGGPVDFIALYLPYMGLPNGYGQHRCQSLAWRRTGTCVGRGTGIAF